MAVQCIICFVATVMSWRWMLGKSGWFRKRGKAVRNCAAVFSGCSPRWYVWVFFPHFFGRQWKILCYKNNQTHHHIITDFYCSWVLGIKCAPRAFHPHLKISGMNKYTPQISNTHIFHRFMIFFTIHRELRYLFAIKPARGVGYGMESSVVLPSQQRQGKCFSRFLVHTTFCDFQIKDSCDFFGFSQHPYRWKHSVAFCSFYLPAFVSHSFWTGETEGRFNLKTTKTMRDHNSILLVSWGWVFCVIGQLFTAFPRCWRLLNGKQRGKQASANNSIRSFSKRCSYQREKAGSQHK